MYPEAGERMDFAEMVVTLGIFAVSFANSRAGECVPVLLGQMEPLIAATFDHDASVGVDLIHAEGREPDGTAHDGGSRHAAADPLLHLLVVAARPVEPGLDNLRPNEFNREVGEGQAMLSQDIKEGLGV